MNWFYYNLEFNNQFSSVYVLWAGLILSTHPTLNSTPLLPIFPQDPPLYLPSFFMFPILWSPLLPPSFSFSLPCHSTLLNCSSNGKDGSVEMERIEKRRGGNQWDNRQGRGPGQQGWPLHWSVETTHTCTRACTRACACTCMRTHTHRITTDSCYSMYSTHNHRPLHKRSPFKSHSVEVCEYAAAVSAVCMGLGGGGGVVQGLWR